MSSMKASDYSLTEIQLSNHFLSFLVCFYKQSKRNLQHVQDAFNIDESRTMHRTGKKLIHISSLAKKKKKRKVCWENTFLMRNNMEEFQIT